MAQGRGRRSIEEAIIFVAARSRGRALEHARARARSRSERAKWANESIRTYGHSRVGRFARCVLVGVITEARTSRHERERERYDRSYTQIGREIERSRPNTTR
ncbi:hypothetical protein K0M31_011305 [Melipona bicolor]|uniref:Uncharacterized protein n=1 Tax=Melipona bicolor TaxID=60889 RepID=A0AA40G9I5_9HYME|nr:hypothetical protein K0M31_011305 [Melipona bicolor]